MSGLQRDETMTREVRTRNCICWDRLVMIVVVLVGTARCVSAQQNLNAGHSDAKTGKVELLHVQGNVYMVAGAGANITAQVGDEFVILVDAGLPQMSEEVLAAIRSVRRSPPPPCVERPPA